MRTSNTMEPAEIYAKTELDLRERKERHLNLPVPLRGLLIMVDGNRTVADVLGKARALRLDGSALEALEVGGLIAKKFSAPSAGGNVSEAPKRTDDAGERFTRVQQM